MRSEHLANLALTKQHEAPVQNRRFAPPPVLRLREILFGVGIVVALTVADVHHEALTMKIINAVQDAIDGNARRSRPLRPPSPRNVGGRRMSAHKHAESIRFYAEDAFQTTGLGSVGVFRKTAHAGVKSNSIRLGPPYSIPPQGTDHHRRWRRASCA